MVKESSLTQAPRFCSALFCRSSFTELHQCQQHFREEALYLSPEHLTCVVECFAVSQLGIVILEGKA